MHSVLAILINGQRVVQYHRNTRLPGRQRRFLEKMDADMDQGFNMQGKHVVEPDRMQRAQFVAMQLIRAVPAGNEQLVQAGCAYLCSRLPDLKEVRAEEKGDDVTMELVFDTSV
jgi:hypothetical protein